MFRIFLLALLLCSTLFASNVSIFSSSEGAAKQAARKIADLIVSKGGEKSVLGLATGATMIPVYRELKRILKEEKIDLSNVITFNLDEYLDLPRAHPQSYHSFMFSHLFEELLSSSQNLRGIKRENIHIPSEENWTEYEKLLEELGPVDLQLLGIGRNGHIGFAEPGTLSNSKTMVVELTQETRQDNAHFFDGCLEQVPHKAVTMGISTILKAKEILLLAFGMNKADAIAKTLKGPASMQVPATILQTHPQTVFFLDEPAASLLGDSKIQHFTHARLLLDHQIQEGELWVSGEKIIPPQGRADVEIDVGGKILAPGFIDLQINGAFGCDFSTNPEQISGVAKQLLQFGITAFLPTAVSLSREQYRSILPKLQPRTFGNEGAAILGIHLEGPFLQPACAGAHNPQALLSKEESPEAIYGNLQGVKLVTLAPELPGAGQWIQDLTNQKIVVAAGHSAATLEEMRGAIALGIGFSTHLFNAMRPYHHREPGIVGAALVDPQIPYSLILDEAHLCAETVRLCWKCNPGGLILVSDATEVLGLPDGKYKLGTMDIETRGNHICLSGTNIIAGSKLSLDKAVQALHRITQCSIAEALEAASLKPAKVCQVYPSKGTLAIGSDADFILLSDELEVEATYLGGKLAWLSTALQK